MTAPIDDSLLAEQTAYYRARAPEYDRWWLRQGRFDQGEGANRVWFEEAGQAADALEALPIDDARVLELAPGTGIWTERLARRAAQVVAVDASPEMIKIAEGRLGSLGAKVDFVVADLFAWRAEELFDGIVFCHWISHVPENHLETFLATVAAALRPGGFIFFLDGLPEQTSTARDHVLPTGDDPVMIRRLDDGREYKMVKAYRSAEAIEQRAAAAGLRIAVHQTERYFQYGVGERMP